MAGTSNVTVNAAAPPTELPCRVCGCEDFLHVRSEVLPGRPVTLVQCEDCGTQYSTGVLPWLRLPGDTITPMEERP